MYTVGEEVRGLRHRRRRPRGRGVRLRPPQGPRTPGRRLGSVRTPVPLRLLADTSHRLVEVQDAERPHTRANKDVAHDGAERSRVLHGIDVCPLVGPLWGHVVDYQTFGVSNWTFVGTGEKSLKIELRKPPRHHPHRQWRSILTPSLTHL